MSLASRIKAAARDSAGASALEFALVMPMLATFMFGVWTLGWQIYCGGDVRHAVELGSRIYVANPSATLDDFKAAVATHLTTVPITSVTLGAAPATVGAAGTEHITWSYQNTVQFPFNLFTPLAYSGTLDVPTATTS